MDCALVISRRGANGSPGPRVDPKNDVASKRRETFEVLLEYLATDRLQDDVHALSGRVLKDHGRPVALAVVDGDIRAETECKCTLFIATRGGNDLPGPKQLRNLDRETSLPRLLRR